MTLGDCLVKAVDDVVRQYNFFPLITYKVGTLASIALNAYMVTYAHNPKDIITFAFVSEFIGLTLVAFLCFCNYDFSKSHLIAFAQGLGGWRFPLKLIDTISDNAYIASFVINAIRGSTALQGIDIVRFKTDFKNLKERDVVLLGSSICLLAFSFLACIQSIGLQHQFKPNYDICYR